jgi:hypothetical protein
MLSNVFHIDPLSDTGDGALTGCSGHVMFDPGELHCPRRRQNRFVP